AVRARPNEVHAHALDSQVHHGFLLFARVRQHGIRTAARRRWRWRGQGRATTDGRIALFVGTDVATGIVIRWWRWIGPVRTRSAVATDAMPAGCQDADSSIRADEPPVLGYGHGTDDFPAARIVVVAEQGSFGSRGQRRFTGERVGHVREANRDGLTEIA